jgi:hypothetical protein
VNWNKAFLLWDRRIKKENKVNGKPSQSGFQIVKPPPLVASKVTDKPLSAKIVDEELVNIMAERVPRDTFLLPQTSYQDLGWCQKLMTATTPCRPHSTITGLYNWNRDFHQKSKVSHSQDHHLGLVTLTGSNKLPEEIATRGNHHDDDAVSTTSSAVHRQNDRVDEHIERFVRWLPRTGQTRYFHPTSNSEISLYADAYVKSMNYGPFSKTARALNR